MKKIPSPTITAQDLWNKTPEEFNLWRREYDYPRIINYLKNNLTNFTTWMNEEAVLDEDILEFGPAIFLKTVEKVMIYELKNNEEVTRKIRTNPPSLAETIFYEKHIISRKDITPYFKWAKKNFKCIDARVEINFSINSRNGRKAYISRDLELIDAGNICLPQRYNLTGRDLEFLNMDNLTIDNCWNTTELRLWYCSAINLNINGNLPFVDIYKTSLTELGGARTSSLKLKNGIFQDWRIEKSETSILSTNSKLGGWKVKEKLFNITLENSDIQDSEFKEDEINSHSDYYNALKFHQSLKIAYLHIGQQSNAGKHFYKEKSFEQKALLFTPKSFLRYSPFRNETETKKKFLYIGFYIKSYTKSLSLLFQKYLWGFGEKPIRVFGLSILVIILSSFIYYFDSNSSTVGENINSIYYSIVTFTTLGYGDISQKDNFLKLFSAMESFIGLSLMGLVIAGFASKSKDY